MATIKKGTYRWNDVLTPLNTSVTESIAISIPFTCTYKNINRSTFELFEETYLYNKLIVDLENSVGYWYDTEYGLYPYNSNKGWSTQYLGFTREEALSVYPESIVTLAINCYGEGIQYITVLKDTEVDDTFATWFTANTEPVGAEENTKKFTKLNICEIAYSSGGKCFKRLSTVEEGSGVPTDLTGHTVIVPSGWSASPNYGNFALDCSFQSHSNVMQVCFGYNMWAGMSMTDLISWIDDSGGGGTVQPTTSLTFVFRGGADVSKPSLIQWFVANNATFKHNTGGA